MNEKEYQGYVEDKSRSYKLACKYLPSASQASQACELASDMDELLTIVRREAREAAFTQMGLELRRFGPNIRRVDLLARFQELYREAADSTQKDNEHHG